jgi:hypothetical protein
VRKSKHPNFLTLRVWASKIERDLLAPDEKRTIAEIFRRIADGDDPTKIFGKTPAHRPNKATTELYVAQIRALTEPTWDGKPGLGVDAAIQQVAGTFFVTVGAVKSAYYSPRGKQLQAQLRDPLDDSAKPED